MADNSASSSGLTATPGAVRLVHAGTCSAVTCQRDAEVEVFIVAEDGANWVPMCAHHLGRPDEGLEYFVEVHGFIPAGVA